MGSGSIAEDGVVSPRRVVDAAIFEEVFDHPRPRPPDVVSQRGINVHLVATAAPTARLEEDIDCKGIY